MLKFFGQQFWYILDYSTVGDRIFLRMQDFDFAQILSNLPKFRFYFAQIQPINQIKSILPKKLLLGSFVFLTLTALLD